MVDTKKSIPADASREVCHVFPCDSLREQIELAFGASAKASKRRCQEIRVKICDVKHGIESDAVLFSPQDPRFCLTPWAASHVKIYIGAKTRMGIDAMHATHSMYNTFCVTHILHTFK